MKILTQKLYLKYLDVCFNPIKNEYKSKNNLFRDYYDGCIINA
jgi:hypothetical protein